MTLSGLGGATCVLFDECIPQPLPKEGQVPVELSLAAACTFYICMKHPVYQALSLPQLTSEEGRFDRSRSAAFSMKQLEDFEGLRNFM